MRNIPRVAFEFVVRVRVGAVIIVCRATAERFGWLDKSNSLTAWLAIRFGVCMEASGRYFAGCEGYHVVSEEMVGTQHV